MNATRIYHIVSSPELLMSLSSVSVPLYLEEKPPLLATLPLVHHLQQFRRLLLPILGCPLGSFLLCNGRIHIKQHGEMVFEGYREGRITSD
jgi:hypothetical protein